MGKYTFILSIFIFSIQLGIHGIQGCVNITHQSVSFCELWHIFVSTFKQFSNRNVRNTKIVFTLLNRISFILYLFLFHIHCSFYAYHIIIKKQYLTRDRTHYQI